MKFKTLTLITFLFSLSVFSGSAQEVQTPDCEALQKSIEELTKDKRRLNDLLDRKEKEIEEQAVKIKSLEESTKKNSSASQTEVATLKKQLADTIEILNKTRVLADSAEVKASQKIKESLKDYYVDMMLDASNFLYMPYDKQIINDRAIPTFEKAMGTPMYDKNIIRLKLLKSYGKDIEEIVNFLGDSNLKLHNIYIGGTVNSEVSSNALRVLRNTSAWKEYQQFKYWKDTFLGKIMVKIEQQLSSPGPKTPDQLKSLRNRLEKLIKQPLVDLFL